MQNGTLGRACRAVEKVLLSHQRNRLRHLIYENRRGGFIYPPYGTVLQNRNRFAPQDYDLHKFDG